MICDGTAEGTLLAAAAGEPVGTRFHPHAERASSFKLWLRYAKPSHGTLRVDEGAARVLRESGSSLLPVGITEVEGEFEAGDAVEVSADGARSARGSSTTPPGSCAGSRGCGPRRSASCSRTPPRRPCTGTTSC